VDDANLSVQPLGGAESREPVIPEDGGSDSLPSQFIERQIMAMMSGSFGPQDQLIDKLDKNQLDKVIDHGEAAD
jgi:hypothetical protein